jgi:ferredoxin-thioredoxin reductase catalytic chain
MIDDSQVFLNPDKILVGELVAGIKKNQERYGYGSCPCRLAFGIKEKDEDIICPCVYRNADVEEFGNCYCALYVSEDVVNGTKKTRPIPERRPVEKQKGMA